MPNYVRSSVPGGTFFFTVAIQDRGSRLLVDEVDRLRRAYGAVQRLHPFSTIAICILPDHLHAVWKLPPGDSDFALRWQQIKRRFVTGLGIPGRVGSSHADKREKGIWQRRYWEHQIRDEEDLARHVDYIHFNPVKHGHARRVKDWPCSSFHQWVRRGELPDHWGLVAAPDGRFGDR